MMLMKTKYEEFHDARMAHVSPYAVKVHDADNVVAYRWEREGRIVGAAFVGRAVKPTWRYAFGTDDALRAKIAETVAAQKAHADRMAERKTQREAPSTLKVGDVLVSSWGYDQTNVDFYEVTAIVGKNMVEIRPIAGTTPDKGSDRGMATAVKGHYVGPAMRKHVKYGDTVRIKSYANARPWDGTPMYWSSYA